MFGDAEVASHLLDRGLIPVPAGTRVGLALRRLPGRNLVYRIEVDGAPPLLLKRAVDVETRRGLEREARAYDWIAGSAEPAPFLPRKLDYDSRSSTLALELLPKHRPLGMDRDGAVDLDAGMAADLGRVMARFHGIPAPARDSPPPWILSLVHPPVGILREATRSHLELIGLVQRSSTWREALKSLADEWRPSSFVHGDLRFSNILLGDRRPPGDGSSLTLIDLEQAGPGDPSWDAGWVVAEILASRIHDLSNAFPLARAFWKGYDDGTSHTVAPARLDATIRWAAVAFLQFAYEEASFPHREGTSGSKLLEAGRSLLERPAVWIERVFSAGPR